MKTVYLDHASTTPMYDEVISVMSESMKTIYGNPSSTHQIGRKAKVAIETARKNIAKYIGASAAEIVFTSSGTEGNNLVLTNAVEHLNIQRIITSKIEHHAVLNVVEMLHNKFDIQVDYVELNENGEVNLDHLEGLLRNEIPTLVSLMLVNNEIGTILPVKKVAELCKLHNALFHTDAVQAVGNVPLDLNDLSVDFLVASAHKFKGPKGVGFMYFKKGHVLKPLILGGNQEKGIRSSTENVHGIVGMEKALQISVENLQDSLSHLKELKIYFINELKKIDSNIMFNGVSSDLEKSVPKILNVRFSFYDAMMLFNLDLKGIAASSGSACQSGGIKVSHVLKEFLPKHELKKTSIRFSFSASTSFEDLDYVISALKLLVK